VDFGQRRGGEKLGNFAEIIRQTLRGNWGESYTLLMRGFWVVGCMIFDEVLSNRVCVFKAVLCF
jgi:hypothetical protein